MVDDVYHLRIGAFDNGIALTKASIGVFRLLPKYFFLL